MFKPRGDVLLLPFRRFGPLTHWSGAGGWLGLRVRCRATGKPQAFEQSGGAGLFFLDGEEAGLEARLAGSEIGIESAHVRSHPGDESGDERREGDSDSDDGTDDAEKLRVGHGSFLSGREYTASVARRWFRQERIAGWSIVGVATRG